MQAGNNPRRGTVSALFFSTLGILILFPKVLFRGQDLLFRDLSAMDLPLRHILLECTRTSGWPPLWNPFSAGGQPLAANPHFATFHPLSFPFFVLPWHGAFSLQILLPLVLGFWGMYIFLRRIDCSDIPATLGALAWVFGGYGLSLVNLLPMLWTTAPLPWALAFAVNLAEDPIPSSPEGPLQRDSAIRSLGSVLGLSLSMALIFLGAEPQTIVACFVAVGIITVFRFSWPRWRLRLAHFGLSAILAVGLAACVLLPGMGLTLKTARGTQVDAHPNGVWSLPFPRLMELVTPPLYPWPPEGSNLKVPPHPLYPDQTAPLIGSIYPGLAVAVFAIVGIFGYFRKHTFEVILIVLGAAMALGKASPVWSAAMTLPLMRIGRYPEKWSILMVLGMIICASRTFHDISETQSRTTRRKALWSALSVGVFLVLLRISTDPTGLLRTLNAPVSETLIILCLGFLSLLLLLIASSRNRLRWILVLVALLMTLAEFTITNAQLVPTRDTQYYFENPKYLAPIIAQSHAARLFHVAYLRSQAIPPTWMAPPPSTAIWSIRTIFDKDFDFSQLQWSNRAREMNLDFIGSFPQLAGRQLARYGTGFMADLLNRKTDDPSMLAVGLAPVSNPASPVSCVDRVVMFEKWEDWSDATLNAMVKNNSTFVVVQKGHSDLPDEPSPCTINHLSITPTRLDFIVEAKGPQASVVQLNQTWDPGWRLDVDGKEERLVRTDIAFSSFSLPAGKHRVVLEYHDRLVFLGMGVSALTTGILVLLLWIYWRMRSKSVDS
jgi:hypothetical protein